MTMLTVTFRFYGNLNDFLPGDRRNTLVEQRMIDHAAVKHPIESLGIPHTEIGAILVNRQAVDFTCRLNDGDRVEAYPPEVVHLLPAHVPLRPPTPAPVTFVADTHLGQLAAYLRLLGFDTLYRNDYDDHGLASISAGQGRVLLTRDRGLLKHSQVVHGYCVRESAPRQQVVSVLRRYRLLDAVLPWHRCTRCNGLLQPVPKAAVLDRLEPKTKRYYNEFQQCDTCGQVYWKGSHFERMQTFVSGILEAAG